MDLTGLRALTFDIFGTVVDWRDSIIRQMQDFGDARGLRVDWAAFADEWRSEGYHGGMQQVRHGELPWLNVDALHRRKLAELLQRYEIERLSETEIDWLNRVWHRLDPWPDAIGGLQRLRGRFVVAALSNGNLALLTSMAKHAGLPWDCILSAELARAYKPDPLVYQTAVELLGLAPDQVMMVAAHLEDLRAAKAAGMRTAFVPRPLEFGPEGTPDLSPDTACDLTAGDFHQLATKLGADLHGGLPYGSVEQT